MKSVRPAFTFTSTDFNCLVVRDYFINDCCFGDDVCRWLIDELTVAGYETAAEPTQEDFGWYFDIQVDDKSFTVIIGFQANNPEKGDCWHGWVEHHTGFISRIFGRARNDDSIKVMEAIMKILHSDPKITNVNCETG